MNEEQIKSVVRWFVATFGSAVAGWFAAKGWLTSEQVMAALNSPALLGAVVAIVGLVWGLFVHTQKNAVAVVKDISPDTKVVTKPEIAAALNDPDVTSSTRTKVVAKGEKI